ncbi:MAG: glycerol-3-phosphate acyltransferase [Candidatus Faecousia sp.]|nr:glycerol-3-phosphate acyltransferase [Clostridiales bacterium]MDD7341404.1 glycerol-3-phosphate acyltransferase [Bacillota bacterium]MDY2809251.1 glycerol-3-phosphate acyltransferase [Candidatus Faecousia sp.]
MRNILFYILTVLGGYLLGCSSMAYYVSRWKKVNLSTNGSGNLGASNTTILLGWRMGILVALHDIFKGAAAVLLAKWLLPDLTYAPVAAGCACVMGHLYPFYLKGKGGKGFASYMGMLLALDWRLGLALIGVSLLVTFLSDYIVVGTLTTVVVGPVWIGFTQSWVSAVIMLAVTAVIFYKHRENLHRILRGSEVGLRSTLKGEHRLPKN